ncbi:hypothetical protein PG993_007952 [Apiospora rasikravindrae]|uniref:Uncharacterized protein n=1 Tax=Apiospora rasikravindrae TaxID=990691 RepID=A0ABR1SYZ7_9PEZI
MCQTIVAHHYACGHTLRQYFPNDPICLPGPDLCARVGPLRYHHFHWNQVSDWPSAMHEVNHRYGACDLCAAHTYFCSNSGDYGPWIASLKTDTLAHQSGFAAHEERARAAEEADRANHPFGGWCPELLPAVTAQLERLLWNVPSEGESLSLAQISCLLEDEATDSPGYQAASQWRDGLLKHMILHGNASGASLLMHSLRHIQSLPLGGPETEEWSDLVRRVAHACGMWRHFAPKPEVLDGVARVAAEMGFAVAFCEEERRAYVAIGGILEGKHTAGEIGGAVLDWLMDEAMFPEPVEGEDEAYGSSEPELAEQ